MGEILFLAHRVPFPPDRGDKIRSHHWVKALAERAPVHLACFAETDADETQAGELARHATSHCLVRRRKPLPLAGVEALAKGRPVSLTAFDDARLRRFVSDTLRSRNIGAVFVFSGQMGQYVPAGIESRLVVDLCDVDSAKFEAYGAHGPLRWVYRREDRLLAREEARLAARADATLLISEAEAALFRARLGDAPARHIAVLGNGIDADFFDPAIVSPHPGLPGEGSHFVFTGQMDYPPNVAAVVRFARKILPGIRQARDARFHIVGRAPTAEVDALGAVAGVTVWGEVPDVRPFLKAADAVVAPLTIARGVQNKVLEAMAMARPVLLSPEAATGIPAEDGVHFRICPSDADFVAAATDLGPHSETLGRAARQFVRARMSWDALYSQLGDLVLPPVAHG